MPLRRVTADLASLMPTAVLASQPVRIGTRWWPAVAYLVFVVYGSLVPLELHRWPLQDAWREFLRTSYLNLGVEARADWVANILLYIPLAYLWSAVVTRGVRNGFGRMIGGAAVFTGCAVVAVAIEFAQLFFPPRTVSLNDIVAELIGSGLGVGMRFVFGESLDRLRAEIAAGGRTAVRAAIAVYVLGYLAWSLFPYDFLISAREIADKLASDNRSWWIATGSCTRFSFCIAKLAVETLAVIPVGVLLAMALGRRFLHPYAVAVTLGFMLGALIEGAQLLLASGVAEGASLLTRPLGALIGVALYRAFDIRWIAHLRTHATALVVTLAPLYLAGLLWANRWFTRRFEGLDAGLANLRDVHPLPFYYHYFTTETAALQSLLAAVAMYAPVGVGYWMWREGRTHGVPTGSAAIPAVLAGFAALVVECGKAFVSNAHPDPTNILIAMAAAAATWALASNMHRWIDAPLGMAPAAATQRTSQALIAAPRGGAVGGALALFAFVAAAVTVYPLGPAALALPLLAWSFVLWRWPPLGLPAALALLPLLDFATWTGWVVVNEFDAFVATTLAVTLLRMPRDAAAPLLDRPARFAVGMLALSYVASAAIALIPPSPLDGNALFSYMTSWSALRSLKGPLWALLMLRLLASAGSRRDERMTAGIVAGLCAVVAIVAWQRIAFAGLLDAATDYRVEGPFPELRVGGGDIHAYLVLATPFLLAWIVQRPTLARIGFGAALFLLATYALAATFARGGYVGYAVALAILAAVVSVRLARSGVRAKALAGGLAALALAACSIVPLVAGPYMQARVTASRDEAVIRVEHWRRALRLIDPGISSAAFGMGLGSFPRTVLFKEREIASASLGYERSDDTTFAALGSGRPLHLEQRVAIAPQSEYALSFDVRAPRGAELDVVLCEKSVQTSFGCLQYAVRLPAEPQWQTRRIAFNSGDLGGGESWLRRRPVALGFSNASAGSTIDLRGVKLLDARGEDLVRNGGFARGGARWTFSADDHLPWHTFNLAVAILFEQGWLGIASFALVVGLALARAARQALDGNWFAASLLAATGGFLATGATESLLDGPRVATLFFVIVLASVVFRGAPPVRLKRVPRVAPNAGAAAQGQPTSG